MEECLCLHHKLRSIERVQIFSNTISLHSSSSSPPPSKRSNASKSSPAPSPSTPPLLPLLHPKDLTLMKGFFPLISMVLWMDECLYLHRNLRSMEGEKSSPTSSASLALSPTPSPTLSPVPSPSKLTSSASPLSPSHQCCPNRLHLRPPSPLSPSHWRHLPPSSPPLPLLYRPLIGDAQIVSISDLLRLSHPLIGVVSLHSLSSSPTPSKRSKLTSSASLTFSPAPSPSTSPLLPLLPPLPLSPSHWRHLPTFLLFFPCSIQKIEAHHLHLSRLLTGTISLHFSSSSSPPSKDPSSRCQSPTLRS